MTNEHDQQLATLFQEANINLSADAFTQQLMLDVRRETRREDFYWLSVFTIVAAFIWILAPNIQRVSQVFASLPGDGMILLFENLGPLSTFPLMYILAFPFVIYAFFSCYMNQIN